jgi:CRP-like cAMP-binding protein
VLVLQRASGGFLAEASLLSARYHCDAFARTDVELVAFPVEALRGAIDGDARVRWAWIGMLSGEIRRQRAGVERMALKSVRERLLHWLLTEGKDGRCVLRRARSSPPSSASPTRRSTVPSRRSRAPASWPMRVVRSRLSDGPKASANPA